MCFVGHWDGMDRWKHCHWLFWRASPIAVGTEEVHVTSDFNAWTMSQAMIQIMALTDETFFLPCSSPSILAVAIKEVECLFFVALGSRLCESFLNYTYVYIHGKFTGNSSMWGSPRLIPVIIQFSRKVYLYIYNSENSLIEGTTFCK